ncbi:MAG: helix-turn-helix domain-containing protein [Bacteroidales bacterium]|jgi:excisionase family DNA binding protein
MENPFELIEKRLAAIEEKLEGLIKRIDTPPTSSSPTWITSKKLAQYLGISPSAVTNLRTYKIPYYKLGGRIYFKKEEIDEWIEKTRHKTGGENLEEYIGTSRSGRG